ncbi:MAG: helix-turn-helix domain-containing protein [Mycobacterium sp.]
MARSVDSGLRERKKQQTRAALIAAALDLVERQGYEQTTIEQIAESAEVSPRTVAHYFPTKNLLLLSLLDSFTAAVNVELVDIPVDVPPLQALLAANLTMLAKAEVGVGTTMTPTRMATLLRIVNTTRSLQLGAMRVRFGDTAAAMAGRLGTTTDDRSVVLISAVWAGVTATAWQSLRMNETLDQMPVADLPDFMSRTLSATYRDLAELTADLTAGV